VETAVSSRHRAARKIGTPRTPGPRAAEHPNGRSGRCRRKSFDGGRGKTRRNAHVFASRRSSRAIDRHVMISRRSFASALGASLVALSRATLAQTATSSRRIGFLLVGLTPESDAAQHFRKGLRDAGYSEGRDIVIEWQSARGDYDRV